MEFWKKTIDLERELLKIRSKQTDENLVLEQVSQILQQNESHRTQIRDTLFFGNETDSNNLDFQQMDFDRIFHIDQIRKICIDYRLRFLPTQYFKGGIPEEAVSHIRQIEKIHDTRLGGFHIVAPTKTFQLKNYDDPLLFAPVGNGYFYLIHKWGNDLKASRKLMVWPYRNLLTFTLATIAISLFLTWLTPETKLGKAVPLANMIVFLFAFKSIFAVGMYSFFMLGKKFNASIWDSVYYNN
ncbi:hypothetical protein [Flavobacterium sp.]|uniref:hypothetical protein n=1 Tax=Flavobacterium sp. TaxID=239 RepID=UPI001220594D|nr:hypothetical protein [Flavobacterium sp.]RZJ72710.1 MAG: hypothetical protein EOO49_03475 [Flavobacterium sp.]